MRLQKRVLAVLWLALVAGLMAYAQQPGSADPDARIRYYRQRIGGRSTYPAYARLGLAFADKARASGRVSYYLDAARYLERSLSMQRNYEALLGLSTVSLALHRFPEARTYAQEAVDTMAGDPSARGALFDAHLAMGDLQAAEAALERMQERTDFSYLIRLAAFHEYQGESADALREVEQACALPEMQSAPATTRAWCEVRRGSLQLAQCHPDRARAAYERALTLAPSYFLAGEHLAELDAAEGKTRQALRFYEKQWKAAPDPRYRIAQGDLYAAAGKPQQAAEQRRRARSELLQRAAGNIRDAWHELALLEADDAKTRAEAVRWAEKDWQNRQDVHAADALAWAWAQQGDTPKAEAALEPAMAPGSASPLLLLHASLIRWRSGRADEAHALLAKALVCPVALSPQERRLAEQVKSELASPKR
ncbi:MAG TPA: tetratricopeptide repeat protein [Terriglobales bacterium]|nr:tetratricopeptide repeat protein [Terriglobales bacterium]